MRNGEGYEDPPFTRAWQHTPEYKAIREQKEIAIMSKALRDAKATLSLAGFEVVERIVLKSSRTGKIYR